MKPITEWIIGMIVCSFGAAICYHYNLPAFVWFFGGWTIMCLACALLCYLNKE